MPTNLITNLLLFVFTYFVLLHVSANWSSVNEKCFYFLLQHVNIEPSKIFFLNTIPVVLKFYAMTQVSFSFICPLLVHLKE